MSGREARHDEIDPNSGSMDPPYGTSDSVGDILDRMAPSVVSGNYAPTVTTRASSTEQQSSDFRADRALTQSSLVWLTPDETTRSPTTGPYSIRAGPPTVPNNPHSTLGSNGEVTALTAQVDVGIDVSSGPSSPMMDR